MTVVLDTSAVLALLWDEPGAERVAEILGSARFSAVNLAELTSKLVDRGATDRNAVDIVKSLGIEAVGFDPGQAVAAGLLRRATRAAGLSIGDRACLGLAQRDGVPAITADRAWSRVDLGIEIEVIR